MQAGQYLATLLQLQGRCALLSHGAKHPHTAPPPLHPSPILSTTRCTFNLYWICLIACSTAKHSTLMIHPGTIQYDVERSLPMYSHFHSHYNMNSFLLKFGVSKYSTCGPKAGDSTISPDHVTLKRMGPVSSQYD